MLQSTRHLIKSNWTFIVKTRMAKILLILSCLTAAQYQIANGQCANRQPTCNAMNEAIVETPRNIMTQPMATAYSPQNTLVDTTCNIHQMPKANLYPTPTTIITDYSPTVCKNLADTLQLMVVCNLLQNTKGGSDIALKLASPIINEVLSSSSFSCGCTNPLYSNPVVPNLIAGANLNPNIITSPYFIPNLPPEPLGSPCNNGILSNILGLLNNLK